MESYAWDDGIVSFEQDVQWTVRSCYVSGSPLLSIDVGTGALTTCQPRSVRRRHAEVWEVGQKSQQHSCPSKRREKIDNLKQETIDHATSEHLRSDHASARGVRTIHISLQGALREFHLSANKQEFYFTGYRRRNGAIRT